VTDHPALAPHTLVFEGNGQVLRLGSQLFARGKAPPAQPPSPRLAPLVGNYQNPSTWSYRPSVHAIGERLFLGTEELVEAADGSWRFKSPGLQASGSGSSTRSAVAPSAERVGFAPQPDQRPDALRSYQHARPLILRSC
jgi:hypothetical protein